MNGNQFYANGRVAVMSNKLFGADKFARIADCSSLAEALKILAEANYGGQSTSAVDYEEILKAELNGAIAVMNELCTDENARKYFLCKYDYLNAKALMKSKYMRIDGTEYCFGGCLADPKKMQEAFVNDDYSAVSSNMAEACDAIDAEFAEGNRSPQIIDCLLDKAMYADMRIYAKKSGFKPLRGLFEYTADTLNLMTLFRLKKAGSDDISKWFVDGGSVKKETLEKIANNEQAVFDLPGEYKAFYEKCKADGSLAEAESAVKARTLKVIRDNSDLLSVSPVLEYFVKKSDEIDKLRRILVAIKSGADKEKIKELVK